MYTSTTMIPDIRSVGKEEDGCLSNLWLYFSKEYFVPLGYHLLKYKKNAVIKLEMYCN